MANLASVGENKLLDHYNGTTSFTPTTPLKLRLYTVIGTATAAGTEVVGGSYAAQTITFNASSGGVATNAGTIDFTNMPACTVVAAEIYDSAGTPNRLWWGAVTNRTLASGDTYEIAAGQLSLSLS